MTFEEKLMKHMQKKDVKKRLQRTGRIDAEIRKFKKRYDRKQINKGTK